MANIKKNFNFRNGVQVDDDNLLVTATGLVGIGTTVPTEALDVRGNVKIIGDANITNATIGILTLTEVVPTQIIGAGVSIKSGIVTAQGTGIVTFYGDARYLQGMPTSQWEDTNAGLGVSSIYNTGGTVGIATTNPQSTLQVGNNVDGGERGVGISSVGNINASGIITATSFVGDLTGNISGNTVVSGIATFKDIDVDGHTTLDNVSVGGATTISANLNITASVDVGLDLDVDGHTNLDNVSIAGVSTFANALDIDSDIDVDGHTNLDNVTITGVTTSTGAIDLNADLDVDGHTNLDNVSIAGVTTFTGAYNAEGGARIGNVRIIGNSVDTISGILQLGSFGGTVSVDDNLTITGETNAVNVVASGVITATTELNSPLIGVGTDLPAHDIQVRKTGNAEIQVTSDTGTASVTIGREPSTGNTNNAEFRYGGGAGFNYSSIQSLDLLNYGTGNFNYHLSAANAGNVDGDFHWHKGVNNTRLMTLTGVGGSLGIGITTPSSPLHVIGDGTISGDLTIGGDINPTGTFNGNIIGNVTGFLFGNVNATSGVSTFKRLDLDTSSYYEFGELSAAGVGIGTTMGSAKLAVNNDANKKFTITDSGNVGIKTDNLNGNALFVNGAVAALDPIGIGTNEPRAAVDFADAGQATTGLAANRMFMVPPKVDTSQRAALQGVVSGAVIYNISLSKLQVYVGSGAYNVANWQNLH